MLELNDKSCGLVTGLLVAHLVEYEFSAFRVARLNFDLLTAGNRTQRLCIMIDDLPREVNLLHRAIVELLQSAFDGDYDVFRFIGLGCS